MRSGRVDVECSTTTWTLSRQAEVDFSLITFVDGGSILAKSGAGGGRLLDFDGKRVAVISGTTTEKVLREGLAQRSIKAEIVTVKSRAEGLKLLEASKVDGFASDRTTLIGLVAGTARRQLPPARRGFLHRALRADAAARRSRVPARGEPGAGAALPRRARS